MLMHHARIEYEEVNPAWPEWKSETPSGSIPVLEFEDGTRMCQTVSMARYLGKVGGYQPRRAMNAYLNDQWLEDYNDFIFLPIVTPYLTHDPNAKNAAIEKVFTEVLPKFMPLLEAQIGSKKFMISDELSSCDFFYGTFYVDYWDNPDVY